MCLEKERIGHLFTRLTIKEIHHLNNYGHLQVISRQWSSIVFCGIRQSRTAVNSINIFEKIHFMKMKQSQILTPNPSRCISTKLEKRSRKRNQYFFLGASPGHLPSSAQALCGVQP